MAKIKVTQGGKPLAGARGRLRRGRRGPAGAARQRLVEPARGDDPRARLGRRDQHRAERDHRPAPLRPQGRRRRRRRRPRRDARAVRHPARSGRRTSSLDANGEATVEVPLNDSLTSFRLVAVADAERAAVRHRQHQHPRHAGPAGARRPAAAGARRRPVQRHADPAQHDAARDEGAGDAAGHGQPAGRGGGRDRARADRPAAAGRGARRRRGEGGRLAGRACRPRRSASPGRPRPRKAAREGPARR